MSLPLRIVEDDEAPGRLASLGGDLDIADLCLLGVLSGRDGGIQASRNGTMSRLAVADGALVHVSAGGLQGLAAFKQILGWSRLEFDWLPADEALLLPQNVRLDTAWLLKIAHWRRGPDVQASGTYRAEGLVAGVQLEDLLALLEKKRENGMVTVAAAGRDGVLVLQDGVLVQADTDEKHGLAALDEIRTWSTLRVTYSRTGPPAAAPEEESTFMADLEKLIDELTGDVPDVLSSGIVRLSDGRTLLERPRDPAFTGALAAYAPVLRSHVETVGRMGGPGRLGAAEDLLVFLEKGFLVVRMLGADHFQAVLLAKSSNPALARLVMQQYEPFFLEALEREADPRAVDQRPIVTSR